MDQTRELSSRKRRRATPKTTTHNVDLSSSPAKSQQPTSTSGKRRAKRKVEELVYATKDQAILEEKKEGGVVKYLVNWADHPETGEIYEPSWVGGHF